MCNLIFMKLSQDLILGKFVNVIGEFLNIA